jgi:sugar/nucleoside kinase (ribokinase family)
VQDLDVVGIGNALVDVITHHGEAFLDQHDLVKGAMTLIDGNRADTLYGAMRTGVEMSGGSAANTMTGIASFGGQVAYIGKVADDPLGEVFGHDLRAVGVTFENAPSLFGVSTGRCLIVVTPDAQRTMNTYLGVSSLLGPDDVDDQLVTRGRVVYLEGYLFDRPQAKEAYFKAASTAHAGGGQVSLTLSDSFCVERHREDFYRLVASEVDLLFANEDELMALYQVDDFDDAVQAVRGHCEVAAITRGKAGSVVVAGDELHVIDAHPVDEVIDTTGAGDLYAAGFLYGFTHRFPMADCGRLGSLAAAEVISHVGARPLTSLRRLAGLDGAFGV